MPYSAPLDGIRAIAILAVLIFHISPTTFKGGFTGVDVFFVLSGFLISSIILHDLHEGSFSLREFYLRRVQRLLPNIIVTVLAVLLLWTLLMPPSATGPAGRHGLWTIFNLSNIYVFKNLGGYWGDAAEWAPLTHTWSLGVEEQFYLLFPGSLLLLARFQPRRVRFWLIVGTILSFGLCLYGTNTHPAATFYLLPTRVWELLIGAALAAHQMALRHEGAQVNGGLAVNVQEIIGLVGLGMISMSFILINDGSGFPGVVSLAPTLGTALVLLSVSEGKTRLSRYLSTPFMVGTGKMSYSLYLWHWPLIILGKTLANLYGKPQIYGALAGGIIGVLLAWGAYVGVEQPLRKRGPGRPWRFAVIAASFSIVAFGAVVAMSRQPVADPTNRFDTPAFYGKLFDTGEIEGPDVAPAVRFYDVYFPPQPARADGSWRSGGVIHLYGGGQPKIVVLGSSHALMYSRLIDDICREMGLSVAFLGRDGTSAFFTSTINTKFSTPLEAHEFYEAEKKWLRKWRPEAVLVIDRWDRRALTPQEFDKELRSFLVELSPLAGRVLFVTQVPVTQWGKQFNLRESVTARMKNGNLLPRIDPDQYDPLRKQVVAIAEAATADFPTLRVLRADIPFYREDKSIRYESGRAFYYADNDHLTDIGSEVVHDLFQREIAEAHSGNSSQPKTLSGIPKLVSRTTSREQVKDSTLSGDIRN